VAFVVAADVRLVVSDYCCCYCCGLVSSHLTTEAIWVISYANS